MLCSAGYAFSIERRPQELSPSELHRQCERHAKRLKRCGRNRQLGCLESCTTACGAELDMGEVIEKVVGDEFAYEAYKRFKDAFEDGPLYTCPECDRETYLDVEDACANCGYAPETEGACAICGESFPLADLLADSDMKLCSYHQYVMAKDD